ncbi:MAG: UDP-forming cellulose synthase catalytic subunit [Alphaproteobacteria bacterium]
MSRAGTMAKKFAVGVIWLFLVLLVIWAASQPVNLRAQIVLCGVVAIAFMVLKLLPFKRTGFLRTLFLCFGGFLVLRYLFWRSANTLPVMDLSGPLFWSDIASVSEVVFAWALFIAEIYAVVMFFLSTFVVIDPLQRKHTPLPRDENKLPSVDVFVPSYNEDSELLRVTLTAAKSMRYPEDKLHVYLLDDGGTDQKRNDPNHELAQAAQDRHEELKELCRTLGVTYLTRKRNEDAKAGNLNEAFHSGATNGDLIAVFDADHVPAQDFLERTVGPFCADPDGSLFLVQTPHFFLNADPIERNLGLFRKMPAENEMFYGYIQRGLDKWNSSFFCGSAAVMRRSALDEVDGFSGQTVTEDAETALTLHSKGFRSHYVDEPLVAGLQPETLVEFVGQRGRWAQGMLQLFLSRKNPIWQWMTGGLTFSQAMCYTSNSGFWFFPLARMMFILAPLAYLIFGLEVYKTTAAQFAAYVIPYLITVLFVNNYLFGIYRWPFISELYEYIQSLFTIGPVTKTILTFGGKLDFRVTSKNEDLSEDHLSPLWKRFVLMLVLMGAGIVATIWRFFFYPDTQDITVVVGLWNVLNFLVAAAAVGVVLEHAQRRRSPRMPLDVRAKFTIGDRMMDGRLVDASVGGARLKVPYRAAQRADWGASETTLQVPIRAEQRIASIPVRAKSAEEVGDSVVMGLEFDPQTLEEQRDVVSLVYSDSENWASAVNSTHTGPGIWLGFLRFVNLAFTSGRRFLTSWSDYRDGGRKQHSMHGGPGGHGPLTDDRDRTFSPRPEPVARGEDPGDTSTLPDATWNAPPQR